jgi:formylglycine-generating enzyme required for sulfatase activity
MRCKSCSDSIGFSGSVRSCGRPIPVESANSRLQGGVGARNFHEMIAKQEAEIAQREAEIARVRKAEFEAANAKYRGGWDYAQKGHFGSAEHMAAWQAICGQFGVKAPGDKPASLVWNDITSSVQLIRLLVYGLGGERPCEPSEPGQTRTVDFGGGVSLDLVWIGPGTFMMGSPPEESGFVKIVQTFVILTKGFWMGQFEVTQEQWQSIMGGNPSHFVGARHPVEQVSWVDCQKFIQNLNRKVSGGGFRLPMEAEWEYACRAGTTGPYAGDLDVIGWYGGNSGIQTQPVGGKKPNDFGLYDMHGNVVEWCEDWYGDCPGGSLTDPTGPGSGSSRVYRGGSWLDTAANCRSAHRNGTWPDNRYYDLGFRVVCVPVP